MRVNWFTGSTGQHMRVTGSLGQLVLWVNWFTWSTDWDKIHWFIGSAGQPAGSTGHLIGSTGSLGQLVRWVNWSAYGQLVHWVVVHWVVVHWVVVHWWWGGGVDIGCRQECRQGRRQGRRVECRQDRSVRDQSAGLHSQDCSRCNIQYQV